MRYVYATAAFAFALTMLAPSVALGQSAGAGLSIANYQLISQERDIGTIWFVTYKANLVNTGPALNAVTATVTSSDPSVQTVPGQDVLHFSPVPANGTVTSTDTFTILVDRSVSFSYLSLSWSFLSPVANAGPNQTTHVGSTVTLNGSSSSNPSGVGTLTYHWAFESRPAASNAVLTNPDSAVSSFVADVPGTYLVSLTVSNGSAGDKALVTVSTVNSPPVANAGPNQTVSINSAVMLNGGGSYDVDGNPLTYVWALISVPANSTAALQNLRSVNPTFVVDKPGTYIVQLIVNDGTTNSIAATVTITTANTPPVANAGSNQTVGVGALVQLNGAGSSDVDGDLLTYRWSLITVPAGSTAALSNPAAVNPTFTADKQGIYVAQLIVNDGKVDSSAATVSLTTNTVQAPTANAGPNQTVAHGAVVTLSGAGHDPQSLPLALTWSLITRPPGSTSVLSDIHAANPTFLADMPGTYVAQLIVSDGLLNSVPSTVTITTTNTPPVANAGSNRSVFTAAIVTLDGSNSSDADHDPITYSWSFASRPSASTTTLQMANSATPTFYADVTGTYVVQLIVNDGFTNSTPSTVTITASSMGIALSPNPLQLYNSAAILTITISTPAPAGGLPVTLSGFDPSIISLSSTSVVVPENSTGVNVTVTPLASGSTNIMASAAGFQAGQTSVIVTAPAITITSGGLTAVGIGRSLNGQVTLSTPAPPSGTVVTLAGSPSGLVSFNPPSVSILAGQTTGTFQITGVAQGSASITASSPGYVNASENILVVLLGSIVLPSNLTIAPGSPSVLDVKLALPAPVGGVTITLTSSDPSVLTVPPNIFIAQGATAPATPAQVTGLVFGSATVTASAPGFTGDSKTVTVGAALTFSTQALTVGAGGVQTTNILLSAPAPAGGLTVTLTSNNTQVATVPASVSIGAGATSASVPVTAAGTGSATITARTSAPNVTGTTLSVTVVNYGGIVLPSNVLVGVGQTVPFPIALTIPAPQGGVTITLSTANSNIADISPKTVTIAAGQTQPPSQPQLTGVGLGSVSISASAPGFVSSSQTVQCTASLVFDPTALTLAGNQSGNLTLKLSAPAPAGGLIVNIAAAPSGIVTVPSQVTIAQNTTTATVSVTGVATGLATITGSAAISGIANATATATVLGSGAIALPVGLTIAPGQTVPFAVTLTSAAPAGGVTVTLSSSDSTKVSISPASVSIAAGQTQPSSQPQVTGGNFGSATISANAPGFTAASQSVTVGAALSISPQTSTITGPDTRTLTLNLSAPAPSDLAVNLSASPAGVVTLTSTATIAKGAASTTFNVTGMGAGTATITAAAGNVLNVSNGTAGVTVQSSGALSLPSSVTVGLGQSTSFQVTLPAPAPAGGVNVSLSSSNTSNVTITPATVTIPAGQTTPASAPQITGKNLGTSDITASANLYTSAVKTVQVTATINLSPQNLSLGLETKNLTLTLSGPAPAAGLTFSVSSSNTGVATVGSSSVTIPANSTTANIAVTGVSAGSTVVHVSNPNLAEATANVTVTGSVDIIMPASLAVAPGDTVNLSINLARTYTTTVFLDLSTSDASKATVSPSTISIPAGQTAPSTPARVSGVAGGTATITANGNGIALTPASTVVTVGFGLTLIPANVTIAGNGNNANLTLMLSSPAPAGGITFTLTSSNPAVVTVPSSIFLSATSTSVAVRLTSVAAGSAVIHVSGPNIPDATANVTVTQPGSVTLTGPATVGLSQSANLTVALSSPAPAAGVTVDLTSSDITKVEVSPSSVTIPPGATTPSVTPQVIGVNVGAATITASASGYASSAPLLVNVNATVTWITQNVTIAGIGKQALLTLRLSATAPTAGLTVNLSSSNPHVATIQATGVFIWDGSTAPGIVIPVNSVGLGTTVIHASATNVPDATTTVTVTGGPSITSASLPNASIGVPYSTTLTGSGGVTPYTWSAAGLPAGLTINTATGTISGTPSATGTSTVTVTLTDSTQPTPVSVTKQFPLTVSAGVSITTASLPGGIAGNAYSTTVAAAGGTTPYSWSATGLPAGLSINAGTGAISGTPSAASSGTVTVAVTDSTSPTHLSASKQFALTIVAPLSMTTSALPGGLAGSAYSATPAATGGVTPYTWSVSGLPAGLSFDTGTGTISGTPSGASSGTVTVTVTDSTSPTHQSVTKQFTLTVTTGLSITTPALPGGVAGSPYSTTLVAAGGTTPYTWSVSGLPSGLAVNASTGTISGTPSAASSVSVSVTVTDSASPNHQSATRQFTLTIAAALSITTPALPGGAAGSPYSGTLAAAGGTTPYSWSATGLPTGLSINSSTGAITGTPSAASSSTVTATVTDSTSPTHQSVTKQFTLTVTAGLSITTAMLPEGVIGVNYSTTVAAAGGATPYRWSASGLPAGITMNSGTGMISGTPSAAGSSPVNITVTDSTTPTQVSASRQFTLTINQALSITTASLPGGVAGSTYSTMVAAAGGITPYSWSASGLPSGLGIDAGTGAITGTPSGASSGTVAVTVTDSTSPTHQSVTKQFTLTIGAALSITTTSLPAGLATSPYSAPVIAAGGTTPYTWSATGLPAGITINSSTGAITGTPSGASSGTVAVTVTDSTSPTHQSVTKQFTLTIGAALSIATASLPTAFTGYAYSATVAAAGGTAPYTWSATGLPGGFSINASTGAITGTPSAVSSGTVTITVTDATSPTHQSASRQFTFTVAVGLSITTSSLPGGYTTFPYSATVAATGGTPSYSWTATGLPNGLSINSSTGVISGTPTATGTSTVTVTATDSSSPTHLTASRQFTVTIAAGLVITTASLPSRPAGSPYSATLAATGGTTPYTWSATGLPTGFSIDPSTGAITGNPANELTATVNVTVTDSTSPSHLSTTKQFTLTITPKLGITTASLPTGPAGSPYSATVAATGGTPPYTWTAAGLPAGLTINATTGVISGTPSAANSGTVTITATDSTTPTHQTATAQLTLTISPQLSITTTSLPARPAGSAYSATVVATGGTSPYAWSATGLPAGFSINSSTGVISGNPTATSSNTVNVTVTDATSPTQQTASKSFTLTITAALSITTSTFPAGQVNAAYSTTVAAAGGTAPYTWSATGLPTGFAINASTGEISGNPTTSSSSTVNVTVTDATSPTHQSVGKQFTLTIGSGLAILTGSLPNGQTNTAYSAAVTASGGVAPYTWSSSDLPRSLIINSATGAITGTPLNAGTSTVHITVTDSSSTKLSTTKAFSLSIVNLPLVLNTTSLTGGIVNTAYSAQMSASGGLTPYNWTATGLPTGITINNLTGLISGMASAQGNYNVTVTVTDTSQPTQSVSRTMTLTMGLTIGGSIAVTGANLGQNLQVPITITFMPPPAVSVNLTITSDNPAVTLGSSDSTGATSIQATIAANTTTVSTYVKSTASSGVANITASIIGYPDGKAVVNLFPAGFVLASTNGIGAAYTTYQGVTSALTLYPARLDNSGQFAETQQIRGGYSVNVPISNAPTGPGSVSSPTVAFSGGMTSATASFVASTTNTGVTTISAGEPAPFQIPGSGTASVVATVQPSGILPCDATLAIGKNLQKTTCAELTGSTPTPVVVTVQSGNPSKLLFSTTPTGTLLNTITVTIPQNQRFTPDFYAHAFDSSGPVTYTVSAPGYGSTNLTATLAPSGLVISTPFGLGLNFTLPLGTSDPTLYVYTARLDASGAVAETQAVAGGVSVPVTVTSGTPSVGTISTSPVTISAGSMFASTTFHGAATGSTTLTASSSGWTSDSVVATVQAPTLVVTGGITIGQFLQDTGTLILPVPAPSGGLHVTLQSNSSLLKLATDPTKAGTTSIGIDFTAGQSIATYYIQSLGATGTPTYTATAPGYSAGTGSISLSPSGIVIFGPSFCASCTMPLANGPQPLTIYTAQLDATGKPVTPQSLAGGSSLAITLSNSNRAVGTVPGPAVIAPGTPSVQATFTPVATGITNISVTQPANWTTPDSNTQVGIIVQ